MAKVSFAKPGTAAQAAAPVVPIAAEVIPPTKETAPQPAQQAGQVQAPIQSTGAVAICQPLPPPAVQSSPFDENEVVDIKDIILPRLNLVQNIGELSTRYTPGDILLNGELVLSLPYVRNDKREIDKVQTAAREKPELVVLGFLPKRWIERTENNEQGGIANSPEEVVQFGGTVDYNEHKATGKPWFQTQATAVVLIRKPSHIKDEAQFTLAYGDDRFALALWSMKGTAYTRGAKVFYTARSKFGHLKDGYQFGSWTLDTDPAYKAGNNFVVAPILKQANATTPEFRGFTKSIFA